MSNKVRLSFGRINWKGLNANILLGFLAASIGAAKVAAETGEHDTKKLLTIGLSAGIIAGLSAASGVMTQRTVGPDGEASAFPSRYSTDTSAVAAGEGYEYEPDEPATGKGSGVAEIPDEAMEHFKALGEIAFENAKAEASKRAADAAEVSRLEAQLAKLKTQSISAKGGK